MKYRGLEGLRFLSSIAIVLFHFVPYLYRGEEASLATSSFYVAVDLFFVISGIVIANGYLGRTGTVPDYLTFVWRRIARLFPLHWATLAFYALVGLAAINGLIRVDNLAKYNFAELWSNVLTVQAWGFSTGLYFDGVSWSISAELFVYLLFPLIAVAMNRRIGLGLAILMATLGAAIFVSQALLGQTLPTLTWNLSIVRAIPSFALGVWLFVNRERLGAMPARFYRMGFNLSSALLIGALLLHANDYLLLGLVYLVVASAFVCDNKGIATLPAWSLLSNLGKLTYSIYMLHPVMATVVVAYLGPRLLGTSFVATLFSIVAAIIATFVAAVISYRFFEEPMRRRLSGHRAKAPATGATMPGVPARA